VTRALGLCAIAAAIAFAPAAAHAQEMNDTQTVRAHTGDTFELLAAEYYGDRALAPLIVLENKIQRPRPLRPGERLRIPVPRQVATQKGDDFVALAAAYLGDPKRAPILAAYNEMPATAVLPAGVVVTIPFDVAYTATGTESLAQIASTYLHDSKQAELLREYNGLAKLSVDKGETIAIPMPPRLRDAKPQPLDAEGKQRRDERAKAIAAANIAVPNARTAWVRGDFAGVRAALEPLEPDVDYLDPDLAIEIEVLLAKAHLADDDVTYAVGKLSQAHARNTRFKMSSYRESPKVIAAWKQAGGEVY
jgi:hypothetical protein